MNCALLAMVALVAATLRGPSDIATLTRDSDAIVHARVVRRVSAWGEGGAAGGVIFTRVTLAALATWKGEVAPQITVRVPGGAVGDLDQTVQGVARFGEGEEVVVFLHRLAPDLYDVERWALGKFAVTKDHAVRDRAGLTCVGCGDSEPDELSLTDLRGRVRASLRR